MKARVHFSGDNITLDLQCKFLVDILSNCQTQNHFTSSLDVQVKPKNKSILILKTF